MGFKNRTLNLVSGTPQTINETARYPGTLAYVDVGGITGSLAVERLVGSNWVAYAESPVDADGGFEFRLTGGPVKLSLTGGGTASVSIGGVEQGKIN